MREVEYSTQRLRMRPASISGWCFAVTLGSVPVVALAMWWFRRRSLAVGLPCESRGVYGCAYDANLAAGYGAFVGVGFVIGAGVAFIISRKFARVGAVLSLVVLACWSAMAVLLVVATGQ